MRGSVLSDTKNTMRGSKKRLWLSLMFCILTILGWGFQHFLINLRVYLENTGHANVKEPLAVSVALTGIGAAVSTWAIIIVWPQRPFVWVKKRSIFWSLSTGVFYSIGYIQYIVAADEGLPAIVSAPICGLHVLVPPLWYAIFGESIDIKTAIGFFLSIASLFLFSGLLSQSRSFTISISQWLTLLWVTLLWGIGVLTHGQASKDVTFTQFPQVHAWMNIAWVLACAIYACTVSSDDVTTRSNWIPFREGQLLTFLSMVCTNQATAFATLCFVYADDFNLMVALMSLYIIIPALLGIFLLDEEATWNNLLGLFSALAGAMVLSYKMKESLDSSTNSPENVTSFKGSVQGSTKNSLLVDRRPLLQ